MKRRKGNGGSSLKKTKAPANTSNYEIFKDADEPKQEQEEVAQHDAFIGEHAHWFKKPGEHELQIGSIEMFAKSMQNFLNKDKITKEDLKGPTLELLKNRFRNNIELEYNIEQYHLAMTDRIDLTNLEGERFHNDLSKPLPLDSLDTGY
nr:hypothetical protein [Tanacetum cinerariifolium]